MEFQTLRFSDAVTINPRVPMVRGKDYPFVEMSAVTPDTRDVETRVTRPFTGGGSRFASGDTLFARITPCLENGKIARFKGTEASSIGHGSTEFIVLRGKAGVTTDDFAYYLSISPRVREFAIGQMTGSSGRQRVPTSAMDHLKVCIPSIPEQRRIAHILGTLDDKIELNRQMNRTLDEIARTLFRSWFVDFDPVRAKMEGRQPEGMDAATAALFPDRLVDSPLGPIPEGWEIANLGSIVEPTIGGDWGKEEPFDGAIAAYCLRGVDLGHLRERGYAEPPVRWLKASSVEKRVSSENHVLIAASGAGPTGRPLWYSNSVSSLFDKPVVYSNFCKRFKCNSPEVAVFVERFLLEMRESGEIWTFVNGTSVPNLNSDGLLSGRKLAIPDLAVLRAYRQVVSPMLDLLYSGESLVLAELRDTLLPGLMSGALRTTPRSRGR